MNLYPLNWPRPEPSRGPWWRSGILTLLSMVLNFCHKASSQTQQNTDLEVNSFASRWRHLVHKIYLCKDTLRRDTKCFFLLCCCPHQRWDKLILSENPVSDSKGLLAVLNQSCFPHQPPTCFASSHHVSESDFYICSYLQHLSVIYSSLKDKLIRCFACNDLQNNQCQWSYYFFKSNI